MIFCSCIHCESCRDGEKQSQYEIVSIWRHSMAADSLEVMYTKFRVEHMFVMQS